MFLVDSHCHVDFLDYKTVHCDVSDLVDKAQIKNVKLILAVCTTLSGFYTMMSMIGHCDNILLSCGVHPLHIDNRYDFNELWYLAKRKNVVAIGETGLDYHANQEDKSQQQIVFREHIRVGRAFHKPIIVHTRNAREDTLAILREEKAYECGSVLHCFNEDLAMARSALDYGFYISFSGIVTFKNAESLREIARFIPLDRLLLESDSPYLTPEPYRGMENQPAYVRNIAEYIATLKGISLIDLATVTTKNFSRLFHVKI
ncbi:hydrolase, TatD family [secondary endosymbiont of Heteropsylla cubana]|uniref:Hydrolase, TatD family n=1 Tax=secondary endosymbiont of Heteropsylla cubana TaxID=134287 RepID=J7GTL7_9ENTR|nr:YchF/TatD family DNA exonuclease [secondary endosymbiont of Heteropsylla cubana]AFP85884.1 hydrolase, TatD family [secondary endosymbiont of Heteropsylla cubana]